MAVRAVAGAGTVAGAAVVDGAPGGRGVAVPCSVRGGVKAEAACGSPPSAIACTDATLLCICSNTALYSRCVSRREEIPGGNIPDSWPPADGTPAWLPSSCSKNGRVKGVGEGDVGERMVKESESDLGEGVS